MSDKTLAELADEIWAWQQATFGDAMTVQGALNKLRDECDEAVSAWSELQKFRASARPTTDALSAEALGQLEWDMHLDLLEELADVFFMLVQWAGLTATPWPASVAPLVCDVGDAALAVSSLVGAPTALKAALRLSTSLALWEGATQSAGFDMPAAIEAKLAKNRARTWAKPAADGTISHVKGGMKACQVETPAADISGALIELE